MNKDEYIRTMAKAQLAKRHLYDFCVVSYPSFYLPDRMFLKDICEKIEHFIFKSDKHFLLLNAPPRFGKSLTAQNTTAWLLGLNPANRIMTASYNERLASIFSRNVRNMIQTEKVGSRIVYSDIFPDTQVKYGEAQAQMWTVDGQSQVSRARKSGSASSPPAT